MYQSRKYLENAIILFGDLIALAISILMAFHIRFGTVVKAGKIQDSQGSILALVLLFIVISLTVDLNHHFFRRGYIEEFFAIGKGQVILAIAWTAFMYLTHMIGFSRMVFGYIFFFSTIFMFLYHIVLKRYMTRVYKHSRYSNRILLITTSDRVEEIVSNIREYNEWSRILTCIALVDVDAVGQEIYEVPIVANKDSVEEYCTHVNIDEVFIAVPREQRDIDLQSFVSFFEGMGVTTDINIEAFEIDTTGKKVLNRIGKYSVVSYMRNMYSYKDMILKRLLDIVGSIVGMIILAIATIFVAPAIKLDSPGPVFFGQKRMGKNGRVFTCYKFRSMYQDAEARKKELMQKNEMNGLMFKMEDDPRITKVGKFIRKTSIDELPQFYNVLRGDMSLVGTRPPTVDEYNQYESKHKCRLSMTPGLTGMWQVSGRSDIKDFDEVVKLDMGYIDNWTIWKDIKILIKTVGIVILGKGSK